MKLLLRAWLFIAALLTLLVAAQVNLAEGWLFKGKVYGPGAVDIPDELHDVLVKRGVMQQATGLDAIQPRDVALGEQLHDGEPDLGEPRDFADGFPGAALLKEAGYNPVTVRDTGDDDLLKLKGIGPALLKEIRSASEGT